MKKKIAINGFGRIGRLVYRQLHFNNDIEVVAINDLTTPKELAYLLEYDSSHGRFCNGKITYGQDYISIDGKKIKIYAERNPENLPWKSHNIDLVVESTGLFLQYEKAYLHIKAGAKKVVLSAPSSSPNIKTIVYNVNHKILENNDEIISAASCTTNCLALPLSIIENEFGIVKGWMTTIHASTNDQRLLDLPHPKDPRRGRSALVNIIPASTGAAKAIGKVIPSLNNSLNGEAFRVPVSTGSVITCLLELKRNTSVEEINKVFIEKSKNNDSFSSTNTPIVSSDVIGITYGSLLDLKLTQIIEKDNKQLLKFVSWYDNENSYVSQFVRTTIYFLNL